MNHNTLQHTNVSLKQAVTLMNLLYRTWSQKKVSPYLFKCFILFNRVSYCAIFDLKMVNNAEDRLDLVLDHVET